MEFKKENLDSKKNVSLLSNIQKFIKKDRVINFKSNKVTEGGSGCQNSLKSQSKIDLQVKSNFKQTKSVNSNFNLTKVGNLSYTKSKKIFTKQDKNLNSSVGLTNVFSKTNDLKKSEFYRPKSILSYLKTNLIGRPYKTYEFLSSKDYLYFNLLVKPNNIFAVLNGISLKKDLATNKRLSTFNMIKEAKSSTFGIKFSKKGIKAKVLLFLKNFLKGLRYLKVKKYNFVVFNLTSPKFLRKKILDSLSKFFMSKRLLNKEIIIQIKDKKVFNGCIPPKQRRKKRKKYTLYK